MGLWRPHCFKPVFLKSGATKIAGRRACINTSRGPIYGVLFSPAMLEICKLTDARGPAKKPEHALVFIDGFDMLTGQKTDGLIPWVK